jgi:hypothetical protein
MLLYLSDNVASPPLQPHLVPDVRTCSAIALCLGVCLCTLGDHLQVLSPITRLHSRHQLTHVLKGGIALRLGGAFVFFGRPPSSFCRQKRDLSAGISAPMIFRVGAAIPSLPHCPLLKFSYSCRCFRSRLFECTTDCTEARSRARSRRSSRCQRVPLRAEDP